MFYSFSKFFLEKKKLMKNLLLLFFTFCTLTLFSQIPEGYYDGTENLGGDGLKSAIYNIIKGHTAYPYTSSSTDVWDILKASDRDPNNSENVILFYCGRSINAAQEYNSGNGWDREHVWAKSRGELSIETPGAGTDAHNLRPADGDVNTARNNRWFAQTAEKEYIDNGFATGNYYSESQWIWTPKAEFKGDVARIIFYMATRYEGENGEPDLEVIDYFADKYTNEPIHALLSDLLLWHAQDPVDAMEMNRNNVIFGYQHNRNPFIDHPEWVECIWNNNCSGFWFASIPELNTSDREVYTYNISAAGSDKSLIISGETIPAWLTFTSGTSETGKATAKLSGQPAFSDIGKHTVSIKLTDGTTDLFQNFEIEVFDGNPIHFTSTPLTKINAGELYSYPITAAGDAGATFYVSITQAPSWLSLNNNTLPATLSGTPSMSDVGKASVVLSITDDTEKKKTVKQEFEIVVSDPNNVNNLIISQYYEGESNNKYIEITNMGDKTIDLSTYYLGRWGDTYQPTGVYKSGNQLSGSILPKQTLVYKNPAAALPAYAVSIAVASTEATFVNGNDPIALMLAGNTWEDRVDCINAEGTWGLDKSFYRKTSVTTGNINFSVFDGSGEWIEVSIADVNNASTETSQRLGYHVANTNSIFEIESELAIFPNPAKDFVYLKLKNRIEKVEIFTITLQKVFEKCNFLQEQELNISELNSGTYFVKAIDKDGKIFVQKLILQK